MNQLKITRLVQGLVFNFPARIKHLFFQVNALFEENNVLNEENKRLMRQYYREKHNSGSSGGSASGKVSNLSGVWLNVFIYLYVFMN